MAQRLSLYEQVLDTIRTRELAHDHTPVVCMVSGGSDSTALAYLCRQLCDDGLLAGMAIMHVDHKLRGQDAADDAQFVKQLADALGTTCYHYEIDIPCKAAESGENVEAVARQERYQAAHDALEKLCRSCNAPVSEGRIFTAHNQDDRVENFYMRSIVGTGPGGFRSMRYLNGSIARPCLDVSRQELRDYLARRELDAQADPSVVLVRDQDGRLWRTDATNAHTDRFRAFVRHTMVPRAQERNPRHTQTLCRSMNLIADEDDMLQDMAQAALDDLAKWTSIQQGAVDCSQGCVLAPRFAQLARPLQRRVAALALQQILGEDARVETASVEAVVDGYSGEGPVSGYTANIQGDLALSANKRGLRIEPMDEYRRRRKGI